jgi:hypothetical protein
MIKGVNVVRLKFIHVLFFPTTKGWINIIFIYPKKKNNLSNMFIKSEDIFWCMLELFSDVCFLGTFEYFKRIKFTNVTMNERECSYMV